MLRAVGRRSGPARILSLYLVLTFTFSVTGLGFAVPALAEEGTATEDPVVVEGPVDEAPPAGEEPAEPVDEADPPPDEGAPEGPADDPAPDEPAGDPVPGDTAGEPEPVAEPPATDEPGAVTEASVEASPVTVAAEPAVAMIVDPPEVPLPPSDRGVVPTYHTENVKCDTDLYLSAKIDHGEPIVETLSVTGGSIFVIGLGGQVSWWATGVTVWGVIVKGGGGAYKYCYVPMGGATWDTGLSSTYMSGNLTAISHVEFCYTPGGGPEPPELQIKKYVDFDPRDPRSDDSETWYRGENATWTIEVTNSGGSTAYNVTVSDTFGPGSDPFDLPAGETWTLTYSGPVNDEMYNVATASGYDAAGGPIGPVTDDARAIPFDQPQLAIKKYVDFDPNPPGSWDDVSETWYRGAAAGWAIGVQNLGPGTAYGVVVTDTNGASYFVGDLAEGETWSTGYVTPSVGETTFNTAYANGYDEHQQPLAEVSDDAAAFVVDPGDLQVKKYVDFDPRDPMHDDSETWYRGESATWTIQVHNPGPGDLVAVMVTDDNGMSWGPFDLAAGETWSESYVTASVDAPISNTATATATDAAGQPVGPVSDPAEALVVDRAELAIKKYVDFDPRDPMHDDSETWYRGESAQWIIEVENVGPGWAYDVEVTDTNGHSWPVGTLGPGDTWSTSYTQLSVDETTVNTATAGGLNSFGDPIVPEVSDAATAFVIDYGEVLGHKFHDLDGEGDWDDGEPPLAGWEIQLWRQVELNDVLDNGRPAVTPVIWSFVASTTTDAGGHYRFGDVEIGTYSVIEAWQLGWYQTAGPSFIGDLVFDVAQNQTVGPIDFGNRQPVKTWELDFHGPVPDGAEFFVRYDVSLGNDAVGQLEIARNGGPQQTELGLDSVGPDGVAHFSADDFVPAGAMISNVRWFARWMGQEILLGTTPGTEYVEDDLTNDFEYGASVDGHKWDDTDYVDLAPGDGVWDYPAEPGIPDWTIKLLWQSGSGWVEVGETQTDGNGHYSFTGLLPGTYYLAEVIPDDPQTGLPAWIQSAGPSGEGDGAFTIANESEEGPVDFGNYVPAAPFSFVDLAIEKTSQATAEPGEIVEYTLRYSNVAEGAGATAAVDFTITDTFDADRVSVEDASGGTVSGNTITWTLPGPLAPGESGTITYRMKFADDFPDGTTNVDNTVVIEDEQDTNPDNDTDDWRVVVTVGIPYLPFTGSGLGITILVIALFGAAGLLLRARGEARE